MKQKKDFALTYVEILVLVGLALLILLFAVGLSLQSQTSQRKATCMKSLRGLTQAALLYTQDSDFVFPTIAHVEKAFRTGITSKNVNWRNNVQPYLTFVPECPNATKDSNFPNNFSWGYALNISTNLRSVDKDLQTFFYTPKSLSQAETPEKSILIAECAISLVGYQGRDNQLQILVATASDVHKKHRRHPAACERHFGGSNYALIDGSTSWLTPDNINRDDGKGVTSILSKR